MQHSPFKRYLKSAVKKKTNIKKRLGLFYFISTTNSAVSTFVDFETKQILSVCSMGHVCWLHRIARPHRRSLEAHKIYGAELRYVLDRYFFKRPRRVALRAWRKRSALKHYIRGYSFKFLVYFKGPARYRRVVIKEFTKRFCREKAESDAAAPDV
jgi:hypothetical protein